MGCGSSTPANTTKPKVLVLGASGYVGKATLSSLVSRHGTSKLDIFAGVRDPAKLEAMDVVTTVKADMGRSHHDSQGRRVRCCLRRDTRSDRTTNGIGSQ
mmetsp:Transcript_9890/g.20450  ORF Transcript_9890/g.20450 Transcript_9890/m.20450 type:complete len:100 (+) Transcript_9890:189-488(+)